MLFLFLRANWSAADCGSQADGRITGINALRSSIGQGGMGVAASRIVTLGKVRTVAGRAILGFPEELRDE